MSTANFFFHGLFPDHIEANDGLGKPVCKILFDVDFEDTFHSHLLADLWLLEEQQWRVADIPEYEVSFKLPFNCEEFPNAIVQYYEQVMGPQASVIIQKGPKGAIPNNNVYRAQWQTSLSASATKT